LRAIEEEQRTLQGLKEGFLTAPGGIIRHRGRELRRADLQGALDELQQELDRARNTVQTHDRRCRSVHLAAATQLGNGWDAYLKGLVAVLHYAEHAEANLHDAHSSLCNVMAIVTADGRVSTSERSWLLRACNEVHNALRHVYEDEGKAIVLDRTLRRRLKVESWQEAVGTFTLPLADANNLGEWLKAIDSWVAAAGSALSSLRQATLEQLLLAESQVARFVRDKMAPAAAPEATVVPTQYPLLVPGNQRPRQKKLDLWDRFHAADGIWATLARLAVACGIIAAVVSVGTFVGAALVNVHNGLGQPVTVSIGDHSIHLAPFMHGTITLGDAEKYPVRTVTDGGRLVEQFDADIPAGSGQSIYNVAAASVLVEWTATYGAVTPSAERIVGPVRWTTTDASFVFEQPPDQISTNGDGGTRTVVSAFGHDNPSALLATVSDEKQRAQVIATHARWDSSDVSSTDYWLALASQGDAFRDIIRARLEIAPNDVLTLRAEQDYSKADLRAIACRRHRAMADAQPGNFDLQYVAARCIENETEQDQTFAELHARAPDNGWLAMAVSYQYAQHARWADALPLVDVARGKLPAMRDKLALQTLRMRRMLSVDGDAQSTDLATQSPTLNYYMTLKSGAGLRPGIDMAYYHLGRGAPDLAVQELKGQTEAERRVMRLAAASDGAPAAIVSAALALPLDQGIDVETIWTALALALRERQDPTPYVTVIRGYRQVGAQRILDFITALRSSKNHAEAERLLDGIDPVLRGQAYSAALVIEGPQAPAEWRRGANRLLFIPERPYFTQAPRAGIESMVRDEPGVTRTPQQLIR
ncbi:MAG TPA: hypothetical protein VKB34_15790, partial [Povalibacter sp.]|nr:hypothetical protein [Povalibacter sp.]